MKGSCYCGKVSYQFDLPAKVFQYCHCSRCRKLNGSAFSANILIAPNQFKWTSGESNIQRYEPEETKYYATNFCKTCGSKLPWLSKGGNTYIVTAGTLDEPLPIKPKHTIFWQSRAEWFEDTGDITKWDDLPK